MDIGQCFDEEGYVAKKLDFDHLTLKATTRLLINFEQKWEEHETQLTALKERIETVWKRDFPDADRHGHPEDSDLMKDWRLANVLGRNGVYMPIHIGKLRTRILNLCKELYKW